MSSERLAVSGLRAAGSGQQVAGSNEQLKASIAFGVECDEESIERHHGESLYRGRIAAFDGRKQARTARFDFERAGAIERQIGAYIASDGFFVQVAAKYEFCNVLT